jgi:glyoxylase-like metal-dependent hydrolase (beta-lactamase superfamily II)
MYIHKLTFNPFAENTYLLSNQQGQCIIIDPGCFGASEQQQLSQYIKNHNLSPVALLNTHAHLDHVFGNQFVKDTWGLLPQAHKQELPVYQSFTSVCQKYGLPNNLSTPLPDVWLEDGQEVTFGGIKLTCYLAPGHSPGSLCFYHAPTGTLVGGDVLFEGSIGRTDLPLGNHNDLLDSIERLMTLLPEATKVLPGHGDSTTLGREKRSNPYLQTLRK